MYNYYVSSYKVEHSEDGLRWTVYKDPNTDREKVNPAEVGNW